MEIEALNKAGAAEGQKVRVVIHTYMYMKGSMVIYGVPALFLVMGAVLGKEIMPRYFPGTESDSLSAIFGFSFLLVSFILIKIWAGRQGKRTESQPVIEQILQ